MSTIILFIFMNSLLLIFLIHPLSMGLILLLQTILISLLSGLMNMTFWYSYILFLIMVGGMMVLFMYMTSIASNEKFKFSMNLTGFFFFMLMLLISLIFNQNFTQFMNTEMIMSTFISMNFKISMNKFTLYPMIFIYFILIIYLLITLIAVVKITKINYGPLRQKF